MKNFLTIVASVLLSVLAVWFLLPEMQKYYAQKGAPAVTVTQQPAPQQPAQTSTTQKKSSTTKTAQKTKQQTARPTSNDKNALTVKSVSLDRYDVHFSLQNTTTKPVSDVMVRIIFYNKNGDQVHYKDVCENGDIAPGLAKSFEAFRFGEAEGATRATVQVLSYKYK